MPFVSRRSFTPDVLLPEVISIDSRRHACRLGCWAVSTNWIREMMNHTFHALTYRVFGTGRRFDFSQATLGCCSSETDTVASHRGC